MNPRAATNDLLPFQGSPFGQLGYFSKMPRIIHAILFSLIPRLSSYASIFSVVHAHPSRKTKGSPFNSELPKRRGWDSNPRALADKRFSRPPRYDHFDISPNALCQRQVVYYHALFNMSRLFYKIFSKIFSATKISSGVVIFIFS